MTRRIVVGAAPTIAGDDHVIALTLDELRAALQSGASCTPFHELVAGAPAPHAPEVVVVLPGWRGYRFFRMVEWIVAAQLARHGEALVRWRVGRRSGASGLGRILAERGWRVSVTQRGDSVEYTGAAPAPGPRPEPARFDTEIDGRPARFFADWGAFSSEAVDEGSRLLLHAALDGPSLPVVLDVGTGYGPIGLGLSIAGRAKRLLATEVDSVALALAEMNSRATGTSMTTFLDDDPARAEPTPLTVCNFPTHATRSVSDLLLRGLCQRARHGNVLLVVHSSLEARFTTRIAAEGSGVDVVARATHSVLRLVASDRGSLSAQ